MILFRYEFCDNLYSLSHMLREYILSKILKYTLSGKKKKKTTAKIKAEENIYNSVKYIMSLC